MATTTIKGKRGQKPVSFSKGGLHRSLGIEESEKIPEDKLRSAAAGNYGKRAQKQANMARGMLKKGRQTAARKRSRR